MDNMLDKGCNPLKYNCFDKDLRSKILSQCADNEIKNHIKDLYELIFYQMSLINDQRREIVSFKHNDQWKHYDKS